MKVKLEFVAFSVIALMPVTGPVAHAELTLDYSDQQDWDEWHHAAYRNTEMLIKAGHSPIGDCKGEWKQYLIANNLLGYGATPKGEIEVPEARQSLNGSVVGLPKK